MAGGVEEVAAAGGVQVEEDARDDDDLLLEAGLEEVEAVGDGTGEALQVQPQVEGAVGHVLDDEAHVAQPPHHVVALVAEVVLQRHHLRLHQRRVQHRHRRLLERRVGAAVEVRTAGSDAFLFAVIVSISLVKPWGSGREGKREVLCSHAGETRYRYLRLDKLLGSQDPRDTPAGKAEALGETVDDEHVVLVYVLDVLGGRDGCPVTAARVVVARVELVADERSSRTAEVLDLGQLRVGHDAARRVSRVGRQNDGSTSRNLPCDDVWVNVVAIFLRERCRDSSKLNI